MNSNIKLPIDFWHCLHFKNISILWIHACNDQFQPISKFYDLKIESKCSGFVQIRKNKFDRLTNFRFINWNGILIIVFSGMTQVSISWYERKKSTIPCCWLFFWLFWCNARIETKPHLHKVGTWIEEREKCTNRKESRERNMWMNVYSVVEILLCFCHRSSFFLFHFLHFELKKKIEAKE